MNVTLSMKSPNYTLTPDHNNSLEEKFVGTINHTHTNGSGLVDIDPEKASIALRSWAVSERSTTRVQRVWLYSAIVPAPNSRLKPTGKISVRQLLVWCIRRRLTAKVWSTQIRRRPLSLCGPGQFRNDQPHAQNGSGCIPLLFQLQIAD